MNALSIASISPIRSKDEVTPSPCKSSVNSANGCRILSMIFIALVSDSVSVEGREDLFFMVAAILASLKVALILSTTDCKFHSILNN